MNEAPRDGTEILAYHIDGGNFHPVKRCKGKFDNGFYYWGMRWNKDYTQCDGNFNGWIDYPKIKS